MYTYIYIYIHTHLYVCAGVKITSHAAFASGNLHSTHVPKLYDFGFVVRSQRLNHSGFDGCVCC